MKKLRDQDAVVVVEDLDHAIGEFVAQGYRLEMIIPADEPESALVSRGDTLLRLELSRGSGLRGCVTPSALFVSRERESQWHRGRAGMEYRDLIPGRLGGCCVASHIRILKGGETPDYVHYHNVNFQMIFCRRGWARLVYEDQGPPFVFEKGDCVLQPSTIRHRVLETSSGFEVIEVSSPAEHETWVEHDLTLPTSGLMAGKSFRGQRFVLSKANAANLVRSESGAEIRDTGIDAATNGLASALVVRCELAGTHYVSMSESAQLLFVVDGAGSVGSYDKSGVELSSGDSVLIPAGSGASITANSFVELLHVRLPAC